MTHHPGVGILSAVAKSRSQGARAAFVVVGVFTVVYGAVDAHRPHTRGVAVAVAVVVFATVSRGPNVNVAQTVSTLEESF